MTDTDDADGARAGGLLTAVEWTEPVYESERTRVIRAGVAGAPVPVIVKRPVGAGGERRLRHEAEVLGRLAGIPGVPRTVGPQPSGEAIVLEDYGDASLARHLWDPPPGTPGAAPPGGPMDPSELVEVARGLAGTLARIHERGVLHKDICPENVLPGAPPGPPVLIDYDVASTFAEERPEFLHPSETAGTPAYMAPEQTGRTGRVVDQRADLYGLGATLYAVATGRPPFDDDDPLRLIRDHLTRVPVPPARLNAMVPEPLSDMIMRLLEKEPDRRYQSASGLGHDLARLAGRLRDGDRSGFPLAERDFPARLVPPSRLVGRRTETATLRRALRDAIAGRTRGVFVAGGPGVGKSSLIDELRPTVTAAGGWFIAGKCDPLRSDRGTDPVVQATGAMIRLLLAEPDDDLDRIRTDVRAAMGDNLPLALATIPDFAPLLGQEGGSAGATGAADPVVDHTRLYQCGVAVLGTVASPERPLVMVLDDLQWADASPLGFVDTLLTGPGVPGLLVVCGFRDTEAAAAQPLTAMLARWERLGVLPPVIALRNLPETPLAELLSGMLRMPMEEAARLAGPVAARTGGNPYDTVELVNALRRDGVLTAGRSGWIWDPEAIRRHVGSSEITDLLADRIVALPAPSRRVLSAMACLGGRLEAGLLQTAMELTGRELAEVLLPALEDGLLVQGDGGSTGGGDTGEGGGAVRFRHDRVQQAAHAVMEPDARRRLHLALARRLAHGGRWRLVAAEQYLQAMPLLHRPRERRRVARLFGETADVAWLTNPEFAQRLLATAIVLLGDETGRADRRSPATAALRAALNARLHMALCMLGRHGDADAVFERITARSAAPLSLVDPVCAQIWSLSNRGRHREALTVGLDLLAGLGLRPPGDLGPAVAAGLDALCEWALRLDEAAERHRPETADEQVLGKARLLRRLTIPAFFCDPVTEAWLALQSHRLWVEHGPCADLLCNYGSAIGLLARIRQDHRTAYVLGRKVLALGEALGYGEETARVRTDFATMVQHWFEPLEDTIGQALLAREALLVAGDLPAAGFTYSTTAKNTFECGPTLGRYAEEVEAGISFMARIGNDNMLASWLEYRRMAACLRGELAPEHFDTTDPGVAGPDPGDPRAAGAGAPDPPAAPPLVLANHHACGALLAAVFGDAASLARHSAASMELMPFHRGFSTSALIQVLRALSLAEGLHGVPPAEPRAPLTELDACCGWLAARAADAPVNFLDLARWAQAERSWATGDTGAAAVQFDQARQQVSRRSRPWRQALITERAARFHLERRMPYLGLELMAQARRRYETWGAHAKVTALDHEFPGLAERGRAEPPAGGGPARGLPSSEAIDLMGVLRASQALSSETGLDRLVGRVTEVLCGLTGAGSVRVLLWNGDRQRWFQPAGQTGLADREGREGREGRAGLPMSAVRYAERRNEPLLVEDAPADERFARDPYFAGMRQCSLLVVPIAVHGRPRAMLILENTDTRGAFTTGRLDVVMLIAGQLAVSLDNALLYASLEQRVARRTEELEAANEQLEMMTVTDPLTGLANRRRLAQVLDQQWRRAAEQDRPIALAMIDIDQFKAYNDRYGHLAGDSCLRAVAHTIRDNVRETDLVARYGGEEFAVVLPGADAQAACAVAERIRTAVRALGEPHDVRPGGVLTVSIGVASDVPSAHTHPRRLIESADVRLYRAKRAGRDRVTGSSPAA